MGFAVRIRAAAKSDVGRARERNEDAYLVQQPVFAVADGMGGHRGGNVASALALESLTEVEAPAEGEPSPLVEEIKRANVRILERGSADRDLRGMGTTVTAVHADGDKAHVAHVGDSRAYLLREGTLQQLTEDHTLVQRMVREGKLSTEEAATHPRRSILTRALGVEEEVDVDELTLDLHPGDRVLLCTDGLTSMVERERIQEVLEAERDPERACDALIAEANAAGGDDNITVVLLDVVEEGEAVEGTATGVVAPGVDDEATPEDLDEERDPTLAMAPVDASAPPPRKKQKRGVRWGRVVAWTALVVVLVAAALVAARIYVDRQWYVGDSGGRVAIFNGIPTKVLDYELSHVDQTTELRTADVQRLQPWQELQDGITADSLDDAERIVDQMRQDLSATAPPPAEGG